MRIDVTAVRELRFDDGTPVTAASGIAPLGDGWLVVQDDATSAAWQRPGGVGPVRLFPPVEGSDRFSEAAGTKALKPDLEVACPVEAGGEPGVLLLGSGSAARRTRGALVTLDGGRPVVRTADLAPLYDAVAARLGVPAGQLNLEGASRTGDVLRWYQRGNLAAGVRNAAVEVPLAPLVAVLQGRAGAEAVPLGRVHVLDLGEVAGVGLAVTDAVALPDGRELLSAAAEDTPNAVDDGPVVATALVLADAGRVVDVAPVPEVGGRVAKVEGLALRGTDGDAVHLLAVVDADDPDLPSPQVELTVSPG
ncbi:DUF6910 family protein [Geodermatophilus sp. FMUSA9-8]|uniref:DUF6910 family protein n=1 Tax=Geodermatophilus sp. FMUSA9-8 TaxID=3120155 RepID=UPI0030098937